MTGIGDGAGRRLTPAQYAAVLSLETTVRRVARANAHRRPREWEVADLEALGWVGAIQAVLRFDPANGAELGAFAEPRIGGAMIDGIRDYSPLTRRHYEELGAEGAAELLATAGTDALEAHEPGTTDRHPWEDADELAAALRGLTPAERAVLLSRLRGDNLREAGALIGMSESRASQLQSTALEYLAWGQGRELPPANLVQRRRTLTSMRRPAASPKAKVA